MFYSSSSCSSSLDSTSSVFEYETISLLPDSWLFINANIGNTCWNHCSVLPIEHPVSKSNSLSTAALATAYVPTVPTVPTAPVPAVPTAVPVPTALATAYIPAKKLSRKKIII